jgi:uncharacterized protein YndB with AHSA1/START domain
MPEFSHTLPVRAEPAQVFAVLQDVQRTPEWLERCTGIEVLDEGRPGLGTRLLYHYRDGRQEGTMDGVVAAWEPGSHVAMRYTDRMMDVTVDFVGAPADAGTQLTHTITIHTKGVGRVFTPLIARRLPRQTISAMARLKALVEGSGERPAAAP